MDALQELKDLQPKLSAALKEESYATAALETADRAYAEALAKFEAQHPELVNARNKAVLRCGEAITQRAALQKRAEELLGQKPLSALPLGFAQDEKPRVRYETQGLRVIAISHFPFLLNLNTALVEEFFTKMAVRQVDGVYILPENIRSTAAVEVEREIVPVIDTEALKKMFFPPEPKHNAWQPPANATGALTSAGLKESLVDTKQLPDYGMDDTDPLPELADSPAGESLPIHTSFWDDSTKKGKKTEPVPAHESVPATEDINF